MTDLTQFDGTSQALVPSSAFKENGYIPDETISDEQMLADWQFIERVHGDSQWWIGDWLNRAEQRKQPQGSSIYDEAVTRTGLDYQTLADYKYVAAKVKFSIRIENLTFDHHRLVAPYEAEQQQFLLAKAIELKLSRRKFRVQIPVLLGIVTIEEEKFVEAEPLPMPILEPEDGPVYGPYVVGQDLRSRNDQYPPAWEHEREIKRELVRERIVQLRENGAQLPTGQYSCLVVDPPWPMQKIERDVRPNQVEFDYPTMDEEELKAFPLPDLAADDCHLYLWTTQKHLPLALHLAGYWGFKYQCLLTWVKNVGFTPFSWMYSTEHVLFCTKGNLPLLRLGKRLDFETMETAFKANVREHSRKPDAFYEIVKQVSPGPRLDVFSREKRDGFDQYGNEVEKYVAAR